MGVLLGTATGDALGWMTEFVQSPNQLQRRFGVTTIDEFYGWTKRVGGRFQGYEDYIAAGSYSDDTQLTIATAACIGQDGRFAVETFSKQEFPLWLEYARGAGGTVKEAAKKIQRKTARWNQNFFTRKVRGETLDYRDGGANGVVMRIAPHVLANVGRWEQAEADIWRNGMISHGHPRALVGALVYGWTLHYLLQQEEEIQGQALVAVVGQQVKALELPQFPGFITWLGQWNEGRKQGFASVFAQTQAETVELLRQVWRGLESDISPKAMLQQLGAFAPDTKGSGVVTAVVALYLFARQPDTPWENVVTAVNLLGSDTDSIAAVVGAFGGAVWGTPMIPDEILSRLQDAPLLVQLGKSLGAIALNQPLPWQLHPSPLPNPKALVRTQFIPGMKVFHHLRGIGTVTTVDTQPLRSQDKTVTLVAVEFNIGQSCWFVFRRDRPSLGLVAVER